MSAAESKPAPEASSAAAPAPAGGMKKGPWTAAEDAVLVEYVKKHGEGNWNAVQRNTGLSRCGKSCRLRWANHLRPNLKKGSFSPDEERLILELHSKMGNKWARMAAQASLPPSVHRRPLPRRRNPPTIPPPLLLQFSSPPEVQRLSAFRHRPPPPFPEQRPPQFSGDLSLFEHADFGPLPSSAGLAFGQPQPVLFQPPHMAFAGVPSPAPVFPFSSLGNYDLDPPPPPPPPPSLRAQQSFSMKMELPSSQLFPEMHSVNSGGDLLDALLRERDDRHQHHHHHLNFAVPEPLQERIGEERSPSLFLHSGGAWHGDVKIKIERDQDIAIDDDLSALLGAIPAAAMPSAGESNGQSAITDAGLEMQQATSSLSLAGDEPFGWSIMHRPPLV